MATFNIYVLEEGGNTVEGVEEALNYFGIECNTPVGDDDIHLVVTIEDGEADNFLFSLGKVFYYLTCQHNTKEPFEFYRQPN